MTSLSAQPPNFAALAAEFEADLRQILVNERALGLRSTRFAQMIDKLGGLGAAKALLDPARELPQNTFSFLRDNGRQDLAMEYYVAMEKYNPLFSTEEIQIARWRLDNES